VKIEATVKEIRALLELAELDERAERLSLEAYRRGRDEAQRHLPRPLLERYRSRFERRRPVLVAIQRGTCSGCHVRLPTMIDYQARRAPAIHTCPHCQRMLYVPELLRPDGVISEKTVPRPVTPGRERS